MIDPLQFDNKSQLHLSSPLPFAFCVELTPFETVTERTGALAAYHFFLSLAGDASIDLRPRLNTVSMSTHGAFLGATQWLRKFLPVRRQGARSLALGVVVGVASAATTTTAVWCKPKDTPDYLIPYYLRDSRARFTRYASVKKAGGRRYMTPEDFLCAVLATKEKKLFDPSAVDDAADLFNCIDRNGDGRISFAEFSFLMVLLATKRSDFELGFRMFDRSGKGSLCVDEFQDMIGAFGDETSRPDRRGGLMLKLFGTNLSKRCTLPQFMRLVEDLHVEIAKAEFRQYDPNRVGKISREQFGLLLTNSFIGSHLPFYIVDNLRRMKSDGDSVKFATWNAFCRLMKLTDDIEVAVQLFSRGAGRSLTRTDFARAVTAVGLPPLSPSDIDLLFCLFDRNGDGSIEFEEMLAVMKGRTTFHVQPQKHERANLMAQFVKCTAEALEPDEAVS